MKYLESQRSFMIMLSKPSINGGVFLASGGIRLNTFLIPILQLLLKSLLHF